MQKRSACCVELQEQAKEYCWLFLPKEQLFKVIQFLFTFLPYSSKHRNFVSENCKHTYSIYIIFTFSSLLCSSSHVLLSSVPNSWLFLLVFLCVHIWTYNYLSPLRFANMHLCLWLMTWDCILYQDVIPGEYLSILSQNPFIACSRMAVLVSPLESLLSTAMDNCLSL